MHVDDQDTELHHDANDRGEMATGPVPISSQDSLDPCVIQTQDRNHKHNGRACR